MSGKVRSCPRCDVPLREWRSGELVLDGCDTCGGVWFDGDELPRVGRDQTACPASVERQFTPGLAAATGGGAMRCPACGQPLRPGSLPQAREVKLDACPACRGIWFDEGELEQLASRLPGARGHGATMPADGDAGEVSAARAARTAAGLASILEPVYCPSCRAANEPCADRCTACGWDLDAPPPDGDDDEVVDVFRVRRLGLLPSLILGLGAIMVYYAIRIGDPAVAERIRWPGLVALAVALALLLLTQTWLIVVRTDGLLLRGLVKRRFVPWSAIHGAATFDIPLGRRGRYRGRRGLAPWQAMEAYDPDQTVGVQMVLYTSRGIFSFGPEVDRHYQLLDAIRQRM